MGSDLENIYQSALKFLAPSPPKETYKIVVDEAMRLVNGKYASIFMPKRGILRRIYTSDPRLYKIIVRERGKTYNTYRTGEPHVTTVKHLESLHKEFAGLGVGSDICVPLSYQHVTIGVLSVIAPKGVRYTERELNILKLFAPLAVLAIRKTHLYYDLEKALESRDLFISIAAHELRTPLTTITAYTQLITKSIIRGEKPTLKKMRILVKEVKRLTKLVDELLQVDRIKKEGLHFEMKKTNLVEIITQIVSDFSHLYTDYSIEFKNKFARRKAFVKGDENKLLQVVTNLLSNAVKFSPPKSKIRLLLKANNTHFFLHVKDKGKGILEEDQKRIFERFYKGKNSPNSGMGIGLFLVKNIVEKHKGTISAHSRLGKGTTFTISLPKYKQNG